MRNTRWPKFRLVAQICVIALVMAACTAAGDTTTSTAESSGTPTTQAETGTPTTQEESAPATAPGDDSPIQIGASLPLTGFLSDTGNQHREGYEVCVDLINERGGLLGRDVELIIEDNQTDSEIAVNQYERLINSTNVELMLGTFASLLTFPTSTVAEQNQMVYLSPSDGSIASFSRGFEYFFDIQQSARQFIGQTPVDALLYYQDAGLIPEDQAPATAAVVNADDFFANIITSGLVGETVEIAGTDEVVDLSPGFLVDAGIEIVYQSTWPEGFQDWFALAGQIKDSGADVLFASIAAQPDLISLVRALKTVGYQPSFMYVSGGTDDSTFEQLGSDTNGLVAHTAWHPAAPWEGVLGGEPFSSADFQEEFEARKNRRGTEDEAIPFAACQVLDQAVRAVGSTDNVAIKDWLHARTADEPVETILGDLYWDERGLVQGRHFLLVQWQDGELEFVFPTDDFAGVQDMVFPKPSW